MDNQTYLVMFERERKALERASMLLLEASRCLETGCMRAHADKLKKMIPEVFKRTQEAKAKAASVQSAIDQGGK